MDQDQTTQNTKDGILSSLAKDETSSSSEILSPPLKTSVKETLRDYSHDETTKELSIGERLAHFETRVAMTKRDAGADLPWLEVDKDLLTIICEGSYPEVGYTVYKNVRVCEKGMADKIDERESISSRDKLFPNKA